MLEPMREAMHAVLGGEAAYGRFGAHIGSTNATLGYHGHIALTLFARRADVDSGAFAVAEVAGSDAKRGIDFGLAGRTSNKGAVGLACRLGATSLGLITCHLASDSKGKSKLRKRNADARGILRELCLSVDDVGADASDLSHHTLLLGDGQLRGEVPGDDCPVAVPLPALGIRVLEALTTNFLTWNFTIEATIQVRRPRSCRCRS